MCGLGDYIGWHHHVCALLLLLSLIFSLSHGGHIIVNWRTRPICTLIDWIVEAISRDKPNRSRFSRALITF